MPSGTCRTAVRQAHDPCVKKSTLGRRCWEACGESFTGAQSSRWRKLLAALFSDTRDKARFELLIEVSGTRACTVAAARATQGHTIDVDSETTSLVWSPRLKEARMHAYHATKAENAKGIIGEGLKPGHALFHEGGRNDARLSPFAPNDERAKEVLGKRLRNAGQWLRDLVLAIINLTRCPSREFRRVRSSEVVPTSATIPIKMIDSVHKMTKKPFSAWRDMNSGGSEWDYECLRDVHRTEPDRCGRPCPQSQIAP
jgi:RNA:NAD 2'-phosphotransferase (TPT1/KptA family)